MRRRSRMLPPLVAVALVLGGSACAASPEPQRPSTAPTDPAPSASSDTADSTAVAAALVALESEYGARVGVYAIDTGDERVVAYRSDERFGYASSIKVLAAAALLARTSDVEREDVVLWSADDVAASGYSPVTSEHIESGLPLGAVAEAAVRQSDNTALNVVLARLGGPAGLQATLVESGDGVTRVDRTEPGLNDVVEGDPRDTSTPAAFAASLRGFAVDDRLEAGDRALLIEWMSGNATGDALIRAGAPEGWIVADKSGGAGHIRNDVAVVTPPGRAPIVIAIFTARDDPDVDYDDALIARAAAVVLGAYAESP